jgi:serine/threonine protein kinase/tetratricopeptide (TPR) repeat protein
MENSLLGGRYQFVRRLGSGGFSRTFLVSDLHLPNHPKCVVKQLKLQDKDTATLDMARRLFDTEARVLYKLGSHPQIPALLAHFEEDREFYLVQEYIEGSRLSRQLVEGQPWSETRTVLLLQEILEILTFVHRQQVIHRDIKPSNLIRRHRDGKIVLIDFGAVKQVSTSPLVDAETGATNLTVAIGTQGYMPNEQYAGKPRFSSDVYAVGRLGICALTGLRPGKIEEDPETSELAWQDHAAMVSVALAKVLDKMVRYDFRDRYPTAQEALTALQNLPDPMQAALPATSLFGLQNTADGQIKTTLDRNIQDDETWTEADTPTVTLVSQNSSDADATRLLPNHSASLNGHAATTQNGHIGANEASPPGYGLLSIASPGRLPDLAWWQQRRLALGVSGGILATGIILLVARSNPLVEGLAFLRGGAVTPFARSPVPSLATDLSMLLSPRQKASYLVRQADRLWAEARYPDALAVYDQAIRIQSDYAPAYLGRCKTLVALKRPSEAIVACNDALAYDSYYPEAVRVKGNALEQQGQLLEALRQYESTTRLMPEMFEGWLDRGRVLQKLGRSAESLQVLNQAILLNRNSAEAWLVRAQANWNLDRFDQAVIALDKTLQLAPDNAEAQKLRERARAELGR